MGQLSSSNAHPPNKRRRLRRTFQAGLGISLSRSAVDKSSETRRSAANTTHPSPDTIASLSPVTITNGHPDDQSLTSAYASYSNFLERYPCYRLTSNLDELQKKEFKRLNRASEKTVYVDYMGGGLYPESLVLKHLHFLQEHVLGNTHSLSPRYHIPLYYDTKLTRPIEAPVYPLELQMMLGEPSLTSSRPLQVIRLSSPRTLPLPSSLWQSHIRLNLAVHFFFLKMRIIACTASGSLRIGVVQVRVTFLPHL